MSIDRMIFALAGIVILLGSVLTLIHSPHWVWLTGFMGLNLFQAAFTGFCPAAMILKRLGIAPGAAF
ncbi:MAG: DUF2892 domain-containing protein [Pseudomonadota bacterium]